MTDLAMALDTAGPKPENEARAARLFEAPSTRMSAAPSRPLVLLVEDSEDDVFFFRRTLKKIGLEHSLVHLADGQAALDYLKQVMGGAGDPAHPVPDLVFLDLKLPTFSGFEILEWIRARENGRALDVTIVSGSEQEADIKRAAALGVSAYCVKPVSADQVRARFDAWREAQTARDRAPGANYHA